MSNFQVYGDIYSGNCYKVKLLMSLLEIEHDWLHIDILKGESRTPEFLERNPNGRVPVLGLPNGRWLFESNAILHYLAKDSPFLPTEPFAHAQVLQWQFFEQYSHEPYIATSRYIIHYLGSPPDRQADLEARRVRGYAALDVMESHLETQDYFVGDQYSIADISLYAYTHVASEGGFSLKPYTKVRNWLRRISQQPNHVTMDQFAP
ncbi:glutathione S-transferase family protein [Acaryochloris sp. IP29b_bin.137]|uniref:glutathione S-transferase family protein n=1 Tax=Acaryochloris sp. IP29b_bin.137 TaxID=2969217 RepID=UPI0026216624|nr:glutathione S-transferase family protein [Acaryochloris sp. IP29b_bin.137]